MHGPRLARLLPIGLYTATAIALLWPLCLHLASSVPYADGGGDSFQFLWNLWWVKRAVTGGENPMQTRLLFWPDGTSLVFHTLSASNGLLSIPLQLAMPGPAGLIASLNLLTLATFAFTGLAAHLLARAAGASTFGSCVAGLMAMTLPYRLWHLNHLNLLSTPYGLFTLLLFDRALCRRSLAAMGATAVLAAMTTYADYETALATALVALVIVLWRRFSAPDPGESAAITRAAAITMAFAFVLHVPLLLSLMGLQRGDAVTTPDAFEAEELSVNLLGFVLPGPQSLLYRGWPLPALPRANGLVGDQVFLGAFFVLALAIGLVRRAERSAWMWATAGALLLVLSLGPVLHVGGATMLHERMPYSGLKLIFPLLSFGRDPVHLVGMAGACLAVALGATFRPPPFDAVAAPRERALRRLLAGALLLLLLLERWPSTPAAFQQARVPAVYATMAADPANYAIMPLPAEHVHRKVYMFWQTVHGKPITDAFVARETRNSGLWRAAYTAAADDAARLALLQTAGIGAIVVHSANADLLFEEPPQVQVVPGAASR